MIQLDRRSCVSLASIALSGAFALACTSTTGGAGGPGADGGGAADTGVAPIGDAGSPGGGEGGGKTPQFASISLTQALVGGLFTYSAGAGFGSFTGHGTSTCVSKTFGPCAALSCPASDAGTPGFTGESAGTITVAGGSASPAVLTYDPAQQRYTEVTGSTQFFKGGDTITATAAGGAIAAFAAPSVIAPNEVTFTAPACAGTACPDIDRTKDMAVAWTNGGAGDIQFAIETTSDVLSTSLFCTFKANAGSGTVPAAAVALLDKADGTAVTAVEIMSPISQVTFAAGSYPSVVFFVQGTGTEGFAKMAN